MALNRVRASLLIMALAGLAACAPRVATPPVATVPIPVPPPSVAMTTGMAMGPAAASLAIAPDAALNALAAFRISCPALLRRTDASRLTQSGDWAPACAAASNWADSDARGFFSAYFEAVEVHGGTAFATGYYEPEIAGSRTAAPGYAVPIYAKPADLLEANPLTGEKGRGRIDETGAYVLYHDRAAIEDGALAGRGLEIAWAADPIDLFFLQIQGSGRLRLPDGQVMRIGYAGQNGREYLAIGRIMKERGLLGDQPVSMQSITAWLRANPEAGRTIMRENKSYVFFQPLTGAGPLGALGVPVTPRATVAADPGFVPLGAPVFLTMDRAEANGLWIAQDTGGAIKGPNRFDTFWGAGADAARIAGGMQGRGKALILLPKGSAAKAGYGTPPRP